MSPITDKNLQKFALVILACPLSQAKKSYEFEVIPHLRQKGKISCLRNHSLSPISDKNLQTVVLQI